MFKWFRNLFRDRRPKLVVAKLSPAEEVLYYSDSKDPDNLPEPDNAYYCYGQKWATRFSTSEEAARIGVAIKSSGTNWGTFDIERRSSEEIKSRLLLVKELNQRQKETKENTNAYLD